ncbi:MAG: hypothetical protein ACXW0Z_17005 [Gemmatirosa sp.]
MSTPPATPRPLAAPDAIAPSFGRAMAAIGHVVRRGRWRLPPRFRAVAWMGGVDVDLTEATIPRGGAALELLAVLGVITLRVPDDLSVALVGDALTWSAEAGARPWVTGADEARLRITGRAVLGKVHLRFVRAPARAAG